MLFVSAADAGNTAKGEGLNLEHRSFSGLRDQ